MDTGGGNWSGLVSIEGNRKAAFNAWKIYAMMPVDRCLATVEGPEGIGAMASSDEHRSGLVVWNLTGTEQPVSLRLESVPFPTGTLRVYRIDAEHASWGDNRAQEALAPVETRTNTTMRSIIWEDDIPDGGVVYLEVSDGAAATKPVPVAHVDRVLHYFPERRSPAYADFDRNTWVARLGMAGERAANAVVGVRVSDLPSAVDVSVTLGGTPTDNGKDSLLGVSVDYQIRGQCTKSVLFHGGMCHPKGVSVLPWGKKSRPDEVVKLPDLSRSRLDLAKHAPKGWRGDAVITFRMHNTGPDTRARFAVRRLPFS